MSCPFDPDDFDPCEGCELDIETCGCDVAECAAAMVEEYCECQREAME